VSFQRRTCGRRGGFSSAFCASCSSWWREPFPLRILTQTGGFTLIVAFALPRIRRFTSPHRLRRFLYLRSSLRWKYLDL
jgi:hypothetical protein